MMKSWGAVVTVLFNYTFLDCLVGKKYTLKYFDDIVFYTN